MDNSNEIQKVKVPVYRDFIKILGEYSKYLLQLEALLILSIRWLIFHLKNPNHHNQ